MSDPKLLPLDAVTSQLNVSKATLYRLFDRGDLRAVNIGRKRLVAASELDRYVRSLTEAA